MAKSNTISTEPLIKITNLKKHFPLKKTKLFQKEILTIKANDGISLTIHKGETLGLVGESGCGKSTLGRVLLQLYPLTSGKVVYYGYSLEEFAPQYHNREIKKLSSLKNRHNTLLKEIENTKAEISKIQSNPDINKQKEALKEKIVSIKDKNAQIYQECLEKCGTFILLNDLKTVNTFRRFDVKISETSKKLDVLRAKLKELEALKENKKSNPNAKIIAEISKLKSELTTETNNRNAEISKNIMILERQLNAPIVDAQIQINRINGQISDIERSNRHFISLVKNSLENPNLDMNSEILSKLVDYKNLHRTNEIEIEKYQAFIDDKKYYELIEKKEKEAQEIYDEAAEAVGAFILSDDIQNVEDELFKNINYKSLLKEMKEELTKVQVSKYRLEQKKVAKANEYTEYQLELLDKKITKIDKNISTKAQKIDDLNKEIEQSNKIIKDLDALNKDKPGYADLSAKRERGIDLSQLTREELRTLRRDLQIIFQDPYSSLNPRMTVGQIIGEGISAHNIDKLEYDDYQTSIEKVMEKCGLAPYMVHRYPHQFSGGQRQRIGIARALALNPKFVVCDEAVSALDVSIQSQIINLLEDLRDKDNLTYLFISHDLSVIKHISNRIGVMYLGNLVELGDSEEIYSNPQHPYTKALISAIPTTEQGEKKRIILEGDIPSNVFPPSGCKFRTRCPIACKECAKKIPEFREVTPGHFVACHFYEKTKDIQANN